MFRTFIFSLLLLICPSISHAGNIQYMVSPSESTVLDKTANIVTVDNKFQILVPADWIIEGKSIKSIDSSFTIADCSTIVYDDNNSMRRAHFEAIGTTIKCIKQIKFADLDGQSYELLLPEGLPINYMLVYSLYGDKKNYLIIATCKTEDYTYSNCAIETIMKTLKPL